jgi:hypothetical protein
MPFRESFTLENQWLRCKGHRFVFLQRSSQQKFSALKERDETHLRIFVAGRA